MTIREEVFALAEADGVADADIIRAVGAACPLPDGRRLLRLLMDLEWVTGRTLGHDALRWMRTLGDLVRAAERGRLFRREA